MSTPYIPARDAEALTWMQTFAAGISADPALYQLQAADAATIQSAVDAFAAAFADAQDPAERTPVNVAVKDEARFSAAQVCRQYAILIKYNAGISNPDKIAIGVRPVNTSRTPVNVPESSPLLNVIGATPGSQTLRYADTNTPDTAAKPFGASSLQLFVAVAEDEVAAPTAAQFYAAFTRNPMAVQFPEGSDGKVATYFARWANRRGDTGPWSFPVSMRIAA